MVDGFWVVQYEGMKGNGGGVVVFIKGRVFGGDTGYIYLGSYNTNGKTVNAQVSVHAFLPNIPSVLGVIGDFDLEIEGQVEGDVIRGQGIVSGQKAVGVALKLTKRADLPA